MQVKKTPVTIIVDLSPEDIKPITSQAGTHFYKHNHKTCQYNIKQESAVWNLVATTSVLLNPKSS
jgi:hypothetical protein